MRRLLLLGALLGALPLCAQDYGARLGTVQRGGRVSFEPTGPGVLFDALDPALRKWYVPQELYNEYRWKQWEYSNYARENYQRYVSTSLEGDYFYDIYGNFLTHGWLIYDWRQENPQPFGSTIEKTRRFQQWFSNLVVASDHKGQYHYALMVSDQIRTTLTPLTFSKPLFNGVQWDFLSDKYAATLLMSRISEPSSLGEVAEQHTNSTNLVGSRLVIQVGDFVKVGGTLVNAHHSQTQREAFSGDLRQGQLTEGQLATPLVSMEVAIEDDSPADGEAGGTLFASDILLYDLAGNQVRGSEIGFRPLIEGGLQRQGYLAADGAERIIVRYDLTAPTYTGPEPSEIKRAQLELVVANDYRIAVASNTQVNSRGQVAFLPVAQAAGNIKDGSNQRVLLIDYGLPTANQIAGFTVELTDVAGLSGYLEVNVNQQYRKYPNPNLNRHHAASDQATAWLLNLSKTAYPYFGFFEGFRVDPRYTTSIVTTNPEGVLEYGDEFQRFEFIDDNDDQDRRPDWRRKGWGPGDDEVFPGLDENNDLVWDLNQNDNEDRPNLVPDYEEPFLRFHTDRPEFLYGLDMNHNGTIDRIENDQEADYPYRRDQEGYNGYAGCFIGPQTRLAAGRLRLRQLSDQRRNHATYLMLALEQDKARWGRLRLFQDIRRVKDTIRDDLVQWQQLPDTRGSLQLVEDILPAANTWMHTTWVGLEQEVLQGVLLETKFKWSLYRQQDDRVALELAGKRRQSQFLGLVNKAGYSLKLGNWTLTPRWKSEFRREVPVMRREALRKELTELFMFILRFPVMRQSAVESGLEYEIFSQLRRPAPPGAEDSFRRLTWALQLSNVSDYQGYRLTTAMGFDMARLDFKNDPTQVQVRSFITVYAGVEK